ncbi:hypothetical protein ACSBR2_038930 [Camellia fascicularis]
MLSVSHSVTLSLSFSLSHASALRQLSPSLLSPSSSGKGASPPSHTSTTVNPPLEHCPRTAYDVSLTDDSWSKDVFHIIRGNTSMSWERLDVGALVSHAFELESEVQALFYGAPAVITFRIPTKAALQVLSLYKSIPT